MNFGSILVLHAPIIEKYKYVCKYVELNEVFLVITKLKVRYSLQWFLLNFFKFHITLN